jgi:cytochrome c peroxidase
MKGSLCILILISLFLSCRQEEVPEPVSYPALMEIPEGFPEVSFPADNAFTKARWELGKKLFYDPVMSVDSSISCASCHRPELAFSDAVAFSPGVENRAGTRNVPPLSNVAYHPYFTREGGVPSLEMQILVPIQEHNEFDFNIVLLGERLNRDSSYVRLARVAYDRDPDPFVIVRALATFERSLLSGDSPYDRYVNDKDPSAMSDAALRGMDLFFSERINCSACHGDFNFTNYSFENNGLYEDYEDEGRFRLTGKETDRARFKVPSLRNVEWTAPYMHDGSLNILEEVVEHYNSGGKDHPQKSGLIRPLGLTEAEKEDLIRFLQSLSDQTFIQNPNFQ